MFHSEANFHVPGELLLSTRTREVPAFSMRTGAPCLARLKGEGRERRRPQRKRYRRQPTMRVATSASAWQGRFTAHPGCCTRLDPPAHLEGMVMFNSSAASVQVERKHFCHRHRCTSLLGVFQAFPTLNPSSRFVHGCTCYAPRFVLLANQPLIYICTSWRPNQSTTIVAVS